jgi:hypothetical protein
MGPSTGAQGQPSRAQDCTATASKGVLLEKLISELLALFLPEEMQWLLI